MPDSKITALTSISTSTDPANDPLVIVDVSDTSMAATGTTKKVTLNQLLGASGTATLASATITGDLTVDTSTLKVDSANNRVGVNTASPATDLEVRANGNAEGTIRLYSAIDGSTASPKGSYFSFRSGTTGGGTETARLSSLNRFANVFGGDFSISTSDTSSVLQNRLTIDSGGVFTFAVGGSTAMTLNATGLGVGVSPGYKLDVAGSSAGVLRLVNINNLSTDPAAVTRLSIDGQGATWHLDNERTNGIFKITRNSTACLTIDNSGNVGIGVTPSALTNVIRLEIGGQLSTNVTLRSTSTSSSARNWMVGANVNAFGDFVIRQGNSQGAEPNSGTDRLYIDPSGNLILQSSATPATLTTNGQLTVNATSNTNLRFSYRGSDGVTRVANITLA